MFIRETYDLPHTTFGPLLESFENYNVKNKNVLAMLSKLPPNVAKGILNTGIGVEVEIEGCRAKELAGWAVTEDHSLRNNGLEYISKLGRRVHNLYPMLEQLFTIAKTEGWQVSDRTSIHVHVNVQNLTMDQLNSLLILYTIFERSLFKYACDERRSNIFCVPTEYCTTSFSAKTLRDVLDNSSKYAAMNLRAVREKGTVEFRQMATNFDAENVYKWILLLALIKRAAQHIPLTDLQHKISTLKFSSDYGRFMQKIFYNFAEFLTYEHKDIDLAISDSKLFFFGGED